MPRRRVSTFRLLRALWRYRGRIADHGGRYQTELATTVRSALDRRTAGRVALVAYRGAMRALWIGAAVLLLVTLGLGRALWSIDHRFALAALLPAFATLWLVWQRFVWGAPLDWLDEHADPDRTMTVAELPGALRGVARELRELANVPASVSRELDALAGDIETEQEAGE